MGISLGRANIRVAHQLGQFEVADPPRRIGSEGMTIAVENNLFAALGLNARPLAEPRPSS